MYSSSSKFKGARPADTGQISRGYWRHDESEAEPTGDENVNIVSAGKYTHKKRVQKLSRMQDFNPYYSGKGDCSVSTKRKLFDDKKQLSAHNDSLWRSELGSSTSKAHVKEVLKLFRETLDKLKNESKSNGKKSNICLHKDAAMVLGKSNWVNTAKRLGPVPGVEVGDRFQYRSELYVIGLHLQFQKGIDCMRKDGILLATSIVATDKYSNQMKTHDVLIYYGEGGNPKVQSQQPLRDQVLEQGNLALKNSMVLKSPVRVILTESKIGKASLLAGSPRKNKTLGTYYVYDGLYFVEKVSQGRGEFGKLVFKFELRKMPGQLQSTRGFLGKSSKGGPLLNDISEGAEKMPIAVVNTVDDERPPSQFTYIARIEDHVQPISSGCRCTDQCSRFEDCTCKAKNGNEIQYDDCKRLVRKTPFIYECNHSCNCSDSCINRVSQHGIQLQLEVFKTESKGWGVRSRSYIRAGAFICEYVGKIVKANESCQRFTEDDYLFDIGNDYDDRIPRASQTHRPQSLHNRKHSCFSKKDWGLAIDAEQCGNVGRFINHSCSPNLFMQNVIYDHQDSGIPHVMLFAKKNIVPKTELTYDYNCRIGEVRYMNGNVKAKKCMCKSPDCVGKFY